MTLFLFLLDHPSLVGLIIVAFDIMRFCRSGLPWDLTRSLLIFLAGIMLPFSLLLIVQPFIDTEFLIQQIRQRSVEFRTYSVLAGISLLYVVVKTVTAPRS